MGPHYSFSGVGHLFKHLKFILLVISLHFFSAAPPVWGQVCKDHNARLKACSQACDDGRAGWYDPVCDYPCRWNGRCTPRPSKERIVTRPSPGTFLLDTDEGRLTAAWIDSAKANLPAYDATSLKVTPDFFSELNRLARYISRIISKIKFRSGTEKTLKKFDICKSNYILVARYPFIYQCDPYKNYKQPPRKAQLIVHELIHTYSKRYEVYGDLQCAVNRPAAYLIRLAGVRVTAPEVLHRECFTEDQWNYLKR